jgi:pseudouridine-5'-phosphate glycosidase
MRIQNIITARETWRLKMSGLSINQIAKKVSSSAKEIENIIAYTNPEYYALVKKDTTSYYDDNVFYLNNISSQEEELRLISHSVKQKKTLFKDILLGTIAIFAFIIMI